ncbi:MAG: exodeoxyribonuclease VII large subunit [Methanomassiliicoccaceae archaeon]|nr:exodeoxyribonuclease VII large subunit [Methanomassiliicoccaceae archaeon]
MSSSPAITVSELNERAKAVLGSAVSVNDVWVSGEISNLTKHTSGHYYFTLKDKMSEIRCTLFRGARNTLQFEPAESLKVTAFGSVDVYVARGSYQFNVATMRRSGIGDMYTALEELKKKLKEEGLFDDSRKRALPRYPKVIGVVTSPTGAVIHDIIRVAGKRFPADILLAPVLVQGDGAAASIVRGIELMNTQDVDVMIVGRGGGSAEDLWAFNEEPVARAIATSRIPVISAVGHETDFTIADMVADVRAPTPSAAAETALPDIYGELRIVDHMAARAHGHITASVERMRNRFKVIDSKLSPKRAGERVNIEIKGVTELHRRASSSIRSLLNLKKGGFMLADAKLSPKRAGDAVGQYMLRTDDFSDTADASVRRMLAEKRARSDSADARLNAVSPMSVLERGYGFIRAPDGKALISVSQLTLGSDIEITMRDGTAKAKVNGVIKNE